MALSEWVLRKGDTFNVAEIVWVMDKPALRKFFQDVESSPYVIFDLETTGLDEHAYTGGPSNGGVSARIVMMTVTIQPWEGALVEPITYVIPLSHPDSPFLGVWRRVLRAIAQRLARAKLVGHNVKFDARWVYALTGINLAPSLEWDTLISSKLLDENGPGKLKEVAPALFEVERWDDVDLKYPGAAEDVPFFDLGLYAARDTYWTFRLFEAHRLMMWLDPRIEDEIGEDEMWLSVQEDVENARLGELAERVSMPTIRTLSAMEQRGIALDMGRTQREYEEAVARAEEIKDDLATRYEDDELDGMEVSLAATSKWFKRFTTLAVEAEDLVIVDMTASGNPQWNAAVLKKLDRNGYPLATALLEQRDMEKRSQFLRAWMEKTTREGRIHANYNSGRVVTGRLSSDSPNMQQVSRKLKPVFVPRKGTVLAEIDYSQIELRVAAMISGCVPMIEAFQRGDDLHRLFGAKLAHRDNPEDVTKDERQKAKSANFGLLYGMSAGGFQAYASTAYGVEVSEKEAYDIREAFFDMWVGLTDWHNRQINYAQRDGYVVSPIGRIRRLPDIWSTNERKASDAERQAINAPVQGLGSDIMQMAAASIEGVLRGHTKVEGADLVGTVHDSIVLELDESRWEELAHECLHRMTEAIVPELEHLGLRLTVPLAAEATIGHHWGDDSLGEFMSE